MTRAKTSTLAAVLAVVMACAACTATAPDRSGSASASIRQSAPAAASLSPHTAPPVPEPTARSAPSSSAVAPSAAPSTARSRPTGPSPATTGSLPVVGMPGVNDPGCRSDDPPVVLLHGTVSTPARNFGRLSEALQDEGRCVYAVLYGELFGWGGLTSVDDSATQVTGFVREVLAATDTHAVDVVAFSQGALVLRDALQADLDPAAVGLAVFIAPNYHGTTKSLVSRVPGSVCPACVDQAAGSDLLQRLAAGGELSGRIRYATISSQQDTWVLPVADQAPRGPDDRVRTQLLEDACPDVAVEHSSMPGNRAVINWVLAALASGARPPTDFPCS